MTNKNVAIAWINNNPARTKNYWTDGQNLYSYNLLIGITDCNQKIVFNYTSSGIFKSSTTSTHVGLVKNNPDVLPPVPSKCNNDSGLLVPIPTPLLLIRNLSTLFVLNCIFFVWWHHVHRKKSGSCFYAIFLQFSN